MRKIILIAGPSGAGKTTISEYLTTRYGIPRVVTHTTRPARVGETPGVSYYFETPESMSRLHLFEKVTYGGSRYGSSREGLDRAWEKSDLVSLIVDIAGARSYLGALGEGGHTLIWFTLPWSLEQYQQMNGRLYRQGQKKPVIIHHLLTKGTIDQHVLASLKHKDISQEALLKAVRMTLK